MQEDELLDNMQKTKVTSSEGKTATVPERDFKAFRRKKNIAQGTPRILQVYKMNEPVPAIDASAFLK